MTMHLFMPPLKHSIMGLFSHHNVASALIALLMLLLTALPLSAVAQPSAAPPATEEQLLIDQFFEQQQSIDEIQQNIEQFAGIEKKALQFRLLDRHLNSLKTVDTISERLIQQQSDGALNQQVFNRFEPILKHTTDQLFERIEQQNQAFKDKNANQDSNEAHLKLYLEHLSHLETSYSSLTTQILNREALGIASNEEKARLIDDLYTRAESFSGMVGLAARQRTELRQLIKLSPDDVELKNRLSILNKQITAASNSFGTTIRLLSSLGFDTSLYQSSQMSLSGELNSDILNFQILRTLLNKAGDKALELLEDSGAQWSFKLIIAFIIFYLFLVLSRIARKITRKSLESSDLNISSLMKSMIISSVARSILILGIFVALSQLGISLAPVLAGLGVAGFIIGFALQDTLGNFASGLMILIYRPYDVGDMVDVAGGVFGKVKGMSLVSTTILTVDNQTLVVPNTKIWGDVIKNITAQKLRRVDLVFGIGYSDNIEHAEKVLWEIINNHPLVLQEPEPTIKLHTLNDSSVDFVVRPWVRTDDYWDVHWDVTKAVKLRFDQEEISIPFPQRDVHIYS